MPIAEGHNDEDRRLYKEAAPRLDKHQTRQTGRKICESKKKSSDEESSVQKRYPYI